VDDLVVFQTILLGTDGSATARIAEHAATMLASATGGQLIVVSAFDGSSVKVEEVDVEKLHAKIGQLTLENDFLEKALGRVGGPNGRR